MHRKLADASGLKLRLFVSDEEDVNAYATEQQGERWVVLNWGLLEALQHDRDDIAAVLAHEYAHHGKEHVSKTKSTESVLGILGAISGAAINYKLGTSQLGQTVWDAPAPRSCPARSRATRSARPTPRGWNGLLPPGTTP